MTYFGKGTANVETLYEILDTLSFPRNTKVLQNKESSINIWLSLKLSLTYYVESKMSSFATPHFDNV